MLYYLRLSPLWMNSVSSSDNSTWGALRLFHHSERLLGLKSAIFEMGKAKNSLERHFSIDHEKQPRLSREPWFLGSTDKEVEIVCLILISPVVLARETSTSSPRWSTTCQGLRQCAKGWDDVPRVESLRFQNIETHLLGLSWGHKYENSYIYSIQTHGLFVTEKLWMKEK